LSARVQACQSSGGALHCRVAGLLEEARKPKTIVDSQFDGFLTRTRRAGWDMDAAAGGFPTSVPVIIGVSTDKEDREER